MGYCNCTGACRTSLGCRVARPSDRYYNPNHYYSINYPQNALTIEDVRRVIREELQDYEAWRLRKMAHSPEHRQSARSKAAVDGDS